MTLTLCTTFPSQPLLDPLEFWMESLGLPLKVHLAPYGQAFQELLSPSSSLAANTRGVNVLLVRVGDLCASSSEAQQPQRVVEDFCAALGDYSSKRQRVPTIIGVLPTSPWQTTASASTIAVAAQKILDAAGRLNDVVCITEADCAAFAPSVLWDRRREELADIPYADEFFAAVSGAIARKVHTLRVPARKVLVLDCDNTLWSGVLGEDGVAGVTLDSEHVELQTFAAREQRQGTLIALCSKNRLDDVEQAFRERHDFPLKWSQLVSTRVNWEAKAQNLRHLAQELNLGLDSFVFLDDNEVECEAIRALLPEVVTLSVRPGAVCELLKGLWCFDRLTVTEADSQRTELYRQDAERQRARMAAPSLEDFFERLNLQVHVHAPAEAQWARVSQLSQRTNQFNLSTRRRTEGEMRALAANGKDVRVVNVSDRFGDYGDVGVLIFDVQGDALLVDTMLLSCRVLGRGVEHHMLRELGRAAAERGLPKVVLRFRHSAKNEPVARFLSGLESLAQTPADGGFDLVVSTEQALATKFGPGSDAATAEQAPRSSRPKPDAEAAESATPFATASERYARIAHELQTAQGILSALAKHRERNATRRMAGPLVAASTDDERRMLEVWRKVLVQREIGVEDNYFELGGTSLAMVDLVVAVEREFGVQLPLTAIVEAPTIRRLAARLHRAPGDACVLLKEGGPQSLFLIHDGDGETLLYRNLAGLLDPGLAVYGIQPEAGSRGPRLPTDLERVVEHHVAAIRRVQPHGPYHLGGMCAGGVLVVGVAAQLEASGETVETLTLMDAAAPQARRRKGVIARERWQRFTQAVTSSLASRGKLATPWSDAGQARSRPPADEVRSDGDGARSKLARLLRFEFERVVKTTRNHYEFHKLKTRRGSECDARPGLAFREAYELAERRWRPAPVKSEGVLLLRATSGLGGDRPFAELFAEEDFGWKRYIASLEIVDVSGGHSSMLTREHVADLARIMRQHLRRSTSSLPSGSSN